MVCLVCFMLCMFMYKFVLCGYGFVGVCCMCMCDGCRLCVQCVDSCVCFRMCVYCVYGLGMSVDWFVYVLW